MFSGWKVFIPCVWPSHCYIFTKTASEVKIFGGQNCDSPYSMVVMETKLHQYPSNSPIWKTGARKPLIGANSRQIIIRGHIAQIWVSEVDRPPIKCCQTSIYCIPHYNVQSCSLSPPSFWLRSWSFWGVVASPGQSFRLHSPPSFLCTIDELLDTRMSVFCFSTPARCQLIVRYTTLMPCSRSISRIKHTVIYHRLNWNICLLIPFLTSNTQVWHKTIKCLPRSETPKSRNSGNLSTTKIVRKSSFTILKSREVCNKIVIRKICITSAVRLYLYIANTLSMNLLKDSSIYVFYMFSYFDILEKSSIRGEIRENLLRKTM